MNAIRGNTLKARRLVDTGDTPAWMCLGKYRFILQNLIFSQLEHRHDFHAVMSFED
jgi:hypothetical protein